jgi:hypothetical protein
MAFIGLAVLQPRSVIMKGSPGAISVNTTERDLGRLTETGSQAPQLSG